MEAIEIMELMEVVEVVEVGAVEIRMGETDADDILENEQPFIYLSR
jgi:hypothetical protein